MIAENAENGENWDFFLRFIIRVRLLTLLDRFKEAAGEYRTGIACYKDRPSSPERSRFLAAACHNMGILSITSARYTWDYNFVRWFEQGCHYKENPEPLQGGTDGPEQYRILCDPDGISRGTGRN